jgi:hypothetical protein
MVRTLAKEVAVAVIHGIAAVIAFIATLYWVSLRP